MHEALAKELTEDIRRGDVEAVRALLDREPALAHAPQGGMEPLTLATYMRQREIADLLIERGAHCDIFMAAALNKEDTVAARLEEEPELIGAFSDDGWTALHLAAHFGNLETIGLLLARGADLHTRSRSREGNMPLHAAVAGRQPAAVDLLLDSGADVNAADGDGWTPVNIAAHEGVEAMVVSLLQHGADPSIPSNSGQTPRETAIAEGHSELASLFPEGASSR